MTDEGKYWRDRWVEEVERRIELSTECERLKEGIEDIYKESWDMQAYMRSSVTLAYTQEALSDLLHPDHALEMRLPLGPWAWEGQKDV